MMLLEGFGETLQSQVVVPYPGESLVLLFLIANGNAYRVGVAGGKGPLRGLEEDHGAKARENISSLEEVHKHIRFMGLGSDLLSRTANLSI